MQVVNFGDCLVRSEGAIALAAVLRGGLPVLQVSSPSNFSLFTYTFSVNGLITVLRHVSCFQELNLSFGEITEAAALVVAQAVMDKPYMERVDLNGMHTVSIPATIVFMRRGSHGCESPGKVVHRSRLKYP